MLFKIFKLKVECFFIHKEMKLYHNEDFKHGRRDEFSFFPNNTKMVYNLVSLEVIFNHTLVTILRLLFL